MAYNMIRKREVDRARAMAHSLHPENNIPDSDGLIALENRYINEEIDAEEYSRLGQELAMRELRQEMAKREKKNN